MYSAESMPLYNRDIGRFSAPGEAFEMGKGLTLKAGMGLVTAINWVKLAAIYISRPLSDINAVLQLSSGHHMAFVRGCLWLARSIRLVRGMVCCRRNRDITVSVLRSGQRTSVVRMTFANVVFTGLFRKHAICRLSSWLPSSPSPPAYTPFSVFARRLGSFEDVFYGRRT